jgi:excisionase family DNA binding protein
MKPFMSVTEAAAELGISPSRVRVLIAGGRLKASRIGERVYLIERADLRAVRSRPNGRPKTSKKGK